MAAVKSIWRWPYKPCTLSKHQLHFRTRSVKAYTTDSQPSWLRNALRDQAPAPKLYAWTAANLMKEHHESRTKKLMETQALREKNLSRDEDHRRIFIIGPGNIGRLFATALSRLPDPPPITLVVRGKEQFMQWVDNDGIKLTRNGDVLQSNQLNLEMWLDEPPDMGPVGEVADGGTLRNIIIATKASNNHLPIDRFRRYLDASSAVVFAQNGMSQMWPPHGSSYVTKQYPNGNAPSFLGCVVSHGLISQGPFQSLHASVGDVAIGPVLLNRTQAHASEYLTEAITAAPELDARSVPRRELWILQLEKLVVNAVINPLTAVLRCKNGVLFDDKSGIYTRVMDKLLAEASEVLQALVNYKSSRDILASSTIGDGQPADNGERVDQRIRELVGRFSQSELRDMLYRVGHNVRENESSMLQDVRSNKTTEIRNINGWIVDTARFLDQNINVSCHGALIGLVESGTVLDKEGLKEKLQV